MSEQLEDLHPPSFSQHMAQGHSFRVARWPAPHGARSRPLLFFSGIGANIELLAPFLQEFGSRDVITFDMPGVGGTAPFPRPYRLSTMAKAAREILSGLGVEDVDVMGVSWGGMLAQEFAYRNRQTVKNLVLAATSAGMPMVPGAPSIRDGRWRVGRRQWLATINWTERSGGSVQLMTVSSPITHKENPRRSEGKVRGRKIGQLLRPAFSRRRRGTFSSAMPVA